MRSIVRMLPVYVRPAYSEVAAREAHGLETDVWSLGVMLYTLLMRTSPFEMPGVERTLECVRQAKYEVPDELSPAARDLIHALLQRHPTHRIPLEGTLLHKHSLLYL